MLTYPRPFRPGRRVSTVCVPRRACRSSDRSRPVQKAPGHGRPLAASSDVAGHDRPCATLTAPGADVPLATAGRGAGSASSARHGERHRRLAGRPAPAAPGGLAPQPCQSPHPHPLALPPRHHPHPHYGLPMLSTVPPPRGGTTGGLHTGSPPRLRPPSPHSRESKYPPLSHLVERGRVMGQRRTTPGTVRLGPASEASPLQRKPQSTLQPTPGRYADKLPSLQGRGRGLGPDH